MAGPQDRPGPPQGPEESDGLDLTLGGDKAGDAAKKAGRYGVDKALRGRAAGASAVSGGTSAAGSAAAGAGEAAAVAGQAAGAAGKAAGAAGKAAEAAGGVGKAAGAGSGTAGAAVKAASAVAKGDAMGAADAGIDLAATAAADTFAPGSGAIVGAVLNTKAGKTVKRGVIWVALVSFSAVAMAFLLILSAATGMIGAFGGGVMQSSIAGCVPDGGAIPVTEPEQLTAAQKIIQVAADRGTGRQGSNIAVMAGLTEFGLIETPDGSGPVADATAWANGFLAALAAVPNWKSMRPWEAAQHARNSSPRDGSNYATDYPTALSTVYTILAQDPILAVAVNLILDTTGYYRGGYGEEGVPAAGPAGAGSGQTMSGHPALDAGNSELAMYLVPAINEKIRVAKWAAPVFFDLLSQWQGNSTLGGGRLHLTLGKVYSWNNINSPAGNGSRTDHMGYALDVRPEILTNNEQKMTSAEKKAVTTLLVRYNGLLSWGGMTPDGSYAPTANERHFYISPGKNEEDVVSWAATIVDSFNAASCAGSGYIDADGNFIPAGAGNGDYVVGDGKITTKFTTNTAVSIPGAATAMSRANSVIGNAYLACSDGKCAGLCDHLAGWIWGYANSGYVSARVHWGVMLASGNAHPGDTNIPIGALMFWDTGPYGHVATYVGGGYVVSNYTGPNGTNVYKVPASTFSASWGAPYLGWSMPVFAGAKI